MWIISNTFFKNKFILFGFTVYGQWIILIFIYTYIEKLSKESVSNCSIYLISSWRIGALRCYCLRSTIKWDSGNEFRFMTRTVKKEKERHKRRTLGAVQSPRHSFADLNMTILEKDEALIILAFVKFTFIKRFQANIIVFNTLYLLIDEAFVFIIFYINVFSHLHLTSPTNISEDFLQMLSSLFTHVHYK